MSPYGHVYWDSSLRCLCLCCALICNKPSSPPNLGAVMVSFFSFSFPLIHDSQINEVIFNFGDTTLSKIKNYHTRNTLSYSSYIKKITVAFYLLSSFSSGLCATMGARCIQQLLHFEVWSFCSARNPREEPEVCHSLSAVRSRGWKAVICITLCCWPEFISETSKCISTQDIWPLIGLWDITWLWIEQHLFYVANFRNFRDATFNVKILYKEFNT